MVAVFIKAIFSCLNLKPNDGFLPYSMVFKILKTGHGLTDIIIASDKFKPVPHPDFFGHNGTYIYCVLEWN